MKFLDYTGLKLVVEQIKTLLNKKADTSYVDDEISKVETMPGDDGADLDFTWDGTRLGIKKETDSNYIYTELKGADGKTPIKGEDYFDGKSIEYNWRGTELGIRVEGQAGYQYVDLKGKDGYTPQKGVDYVDGKDFTYDDFTSEQLIQLKGEDGYTPVKGKDYFDGEDGDSAYQVWLSQGNTGTIDDYLGSLKGEDGSSIADSVEWSKVLNKPTSFPPSNHSHEFKKSSLMTSGNYVTDDYDLNDLVAGDSGIYGVGGANFPTGYGYVGWAYVETQSMYGTSLDRDLLQSLYPFRGNGAIMYRVADARGIWGDWVKLATADEIRGGGINIITSITEPSINPGDQWHREI